MRILLIILVVVLVAGGGTVGFLVYNGTITLAAKTEVKAKPPVPAGATLVPWNVRQLPANTVITREMLLDPQTGELIRRPILLEAVQGKGVITDPAQIIGRVLKADIRPGYVFTEAQFYPVGTRPGLAASIPPGKRSLTVDVSKVTGARTLKTGDHVDLVSTQSYDPLKRPPGIGVAKIAGGATDTVQPDKLVKKAIVKVLAEDAVVVSPLTIQQVPYMSTGTLTAPGQVKTKPVEEISIAVDATEVAGLMQALAVGAEISAFVHSSQPQAPGVDKGVVVPPEPVEPPPETPVVKEPPKVEKIVGRKHEVLVVPDPTTRPATQPAANRQILITPRTSAEPVRPADTSSRLLSVRGGGRS